MEWLLDGTDTSIWDRLSFFSSNGLLIVGTIILAIAAFAFGRRAGAAVVITTLFAWALSAFVSGLVGRVPPREGIEGGSFPSVEVVQTGVFWGLIVMLLWWVGVPKLVWQIGVELSIVITLLVAVRLIVAGEIWPSDAVGSAIVIALALITAAAVLEANPPPILTRRAAGTAEGPEAVAAA